MELQIQRYLRNSGSILDLATKLGISAKRHRQHNNLVLFKYNQIESPMADPIVQECRGIILDENDNWNIIARAFDKFFNHGEGHAAQIDWKTARVQEKVDGSLCLLYPYQGEWHVATTGTPDASGDVNKQGLSFTDYFWQTMGDKEVMRQVTSDFCFMFELTGPINRVVVPHSVATLTLLGARNIETWQEVHPSEVSHFFPEIPIVKEFPLQDIKDILSSFEHISPLTQEGYVIVDASFNRMKVKHPGYVALHHAKDGMTTKAFVEIARSGETSEVISAFPEFKPLLEEVQKRYNQLLLELEVDYTTHREISVQKDFALAIKNSRCSAALFQLRAGKVRSVREFLAKCHIDIMMRTLGY